MPLKNRQYCFWKYNTSIKLTNLLYVLFDLIGDCFLFSRECWVLQSTAEYAQDIIDRTGLGKLSDDLLVSIANSCFEHFKVIGDMPLPIFAKAHRWYDCFKNYFICIYTAYDLYLLTRKCKMGFLNGILVFSRLTTSHLSSISIFSTKRFNVCL